MDSKKMLQEVEEQIARLTMVRDSIRKAFGTQPQPEAAPKKAAKPAAKRTVKRASPGVNSDLLLQWMGNQTEPKANTEILEGVKAIGWTSTGKSPLNILTISLNYHKKHGNVQKDGTEWVITEQGKKRAYPDRQVGA